MSPSPTAPVHASGCRHCGLPIPATRRDRGDHFCCEGCLRVYDLIRGAGLGRFYELGGGSSAPATERRPDSFAWLDRLLDAMPAESGAPEAASSSGGSDPEPRATQPRRLTLDIQGVHCAACVWLLRELFLRRAGACDLRINPAVGQAEAIWIPGQCDLRGYLVDAERFGYTFGPRAKSVSRRSRDLFVRLGICAAAAMNVMIFSICFYAGLGPGDGRIYDFFGRLNFGLTLVAVLTGGWVFFRGAIAGIRRGLVHLDLPIALGIILAFTGSVYAWRTEGPGAAYFDTVAIFVTLMLVGRVLQERILERNRNTLLASQGIGDLHARRVRDGSVEAIPASEIRRGDELWVVPGDLVPVEATLLSRPGEISLDWITGESRSVPVAPGETVPAGAVNAGHELLRLGTLQDFDESRLNDLLRDPAAAASRRDEGGGRWWHRLATLYVLGVLSLAAAGFLAWAGRDMHRALLVTVSILVITCPCAIGLATPLAQELTHAALRRKGIFLREGSFLERSRRVRRVIFDKTGTLTLSRLVLRPDSRTALAGLDREMRSVLYAMALRSNHPVSRCLAEELRILRETPALAGAEEVQELPGAGLQWRHEAAHYRLGRAPGRNGPGETAFSVDDHLLATFSFSEEIRHDAAEEVRRLGAAGLEVHLLSGDTPARTRDVAAALGIPEGRFEGGLDPHGKAERVRSLDQQDTMMVGDGLNDAPSFDVAFCTATPAVDRPALPARADLYYLGEGVGAVRQALVGAERFRRVVRSNLLFALAYNAGALALCFGGVVSPLLAAVLMPVSSAGVVGHTIYRLNRADPGETPAVSD